MNPEMEEVGLETVAKGALPEMFEAALDVVMRNIRDPNTEATDERAITIVVRITPNEDRDAATHTVVVKEKLAPQKPAGGIMYFGQHKNGKLAASTLDPRQLVLGEDPDARDVLPLSRAAEQGAR